mmetsp:Transcript_9469/g.15789  ORF Transcript_9469/g.15789 Transcript_9469/m.15789 type:complete len:261 (-) Transcript_9469:70-852(-)
MQLGIHGVLLFESVEEEVDFSSTVCHVILQRVVEYAVCFAGGLNRLAQRHLEVALQEECAAACQRVGAHPHKQERVGDEHAGTSDWYDGHMHADVGTHQQRCQKHKRLQHAGPQCALGKARAAQQQEIQDTLGKLRVQYRNDGPLTQEGLQLIHCRFVVGDLFRDLTELILEGVTDQGFALEVHQQPTGRRSQNGRCTYPEQDVPSVGGKAGDNNQEAQSNCNAGNMGQVECRAKAIGSRCEGLHHVKGHVDYAPHLTKP